MKYFVAGDSIVRQIWGKADTILFIFAGASAEFALNKAVDWLYFTGKLPADPLGRLFSTVAYARQIVFADEESAFRAIDVITGIHLDVEKKRGKSIPEEAYRDVLFLLIDYSIRSFEALERKLTEEEKAEAFNVFYRVGARMGIRNLPETFQKWKIMREEHLTANLVAGEFTADLYKQYRKHLGIVRFYLLKQVQILVVPNSVNNLLSLGTSRAIRPVLSAYKASQVFGIAKIIRNSLLPKEYKSQVLALDLAHKAAPEII